MDCYFFIYVHHDHPTSPQVLKSQNLPSNLGEYLDCNPSPNIWWKQKKCATTHQEWYICRQDTNWQSHTREKSLSQNAHDVAITESIPHVEYGSFESKAPPKKKRGFGWIEKPLFSRLITLWCVSKAICYRCRLSNFDRDCSSSLTDVKDFSRVVM
jgi:hypothetical protein